MTLETAANWATIVTAGIATAALVSGIIWWYWVVRRWRRRINEDIKILQENAKLMQSTWNSAFDLATKYPQSDPSQSYLGAIGVQLTAIYTLLTIQFGHDHAYRTPNRELQELIETIRSLSVQPPIVIKRDKG